MPKVSEKTEHVKRGPTSKCLIEIRNLPLERFRMAHDGRKWKQVARSRSLVLVYIATFADGDGNVGKYSPGIERQTKRHGFTARWLYRLHDDLNALGFLSWKRENRQEKREYTITIPTDPDVNYSQASDVNYSLSDVKYSSPDVNYSASDVNSRVSATVLPSKEPSVSVSEQLGEMPAEIARLWNDLLQTRKHVPSIAQQRALLRTLLDIRADGYDVERLMNYAIENSVSLDKAAKNLWNISRVPKQSEPVADDDREIYSVADLRAMLEHFRQREREGLLHPGAIEKWKAQMRMSFPESWAAFERDSEEKSTVATAGGPSRS